MNGNIGKCDFNGNVVYTFQTIDTQQIELAKLNFHSIQWETLKTKANSLIDFMQI